MKLLPEVQNRVIDYTCSYQVTESNYRWEKKQQKVLWLLCIYEEDVLQFFVKNIPISKPTAQR